MTLGGSVSNFKTVEYEGGVGKVRQPTYLIIVSHDGS